MFGVLKTHADALLGELDAQKTLRAQVEAAAGPLLHTGDLGVDLIARKMGLSRQTLYRRLKAENATFEAIVDDLRHRLALHYLQDGKRSVNETAFLVGFSEPAAFSRAFKRWTGATPGSMRR
jgi:AraC-like DNA-binding protein